MNNKFIFEDCGRIAYQDALEKQTAAFDNILAAKREGKTIINRLFFCEHYPVITLGKSARETNLLVSESTLAAKGISLYHVGRGGDITYHGPGQATVYPVFDLEQWGIGLRTYIHYLEETVIDFLRLYSIEGYRIEGAAGVWTGAKPKKICAIGVRSSRFVTMHGFALNINTALDAFSLINPCGFTDKGVTSIANELGKEENYEQAKTLLLSIFRKTFGAD